MMLETKDLCVRYGMIRALNNLNIHVDKGEIVTIIGANGAGKSSLMNTIAGQVRPASGQVLFNGKPLPKGSHRIVKEGIALSPEGRRIFGSLTVQENLIMGAYLQNDKAQMDKDMEEVYSIFPRLKERAAQLSNTLSGGEQQMLAMGRAMMSRPQLLMLDEPSLGLAPILVKEIFSTIRLLNQRGTTILLVEQNAKQALMLADRAYVLQTGNLVKEGKASDLLHDPDVEASYLGTKKG